MSEQQPSESLIPIKRLPGERAFTDEVIEEAQLRGWQTFHLRDRDSIHIVRGRGFPDLVMFRGDQFVVAELKRDEASELRDDQNEWIAAFRQHVYARDWRPKDWDEIQTILRDGPPTWHGDDNKTLPSGQTLASDSPIPARLCLLISGLAETIEAEEFERGDRSKLRRMNPDNPSTAAFWRLMAREGIPRNPDISKWGLIIHGIALMSHGTGLAHNPKLRVGRVLYEGNKNKPPPLISEHRLSTLLSARGPTLRRLLARLFRMLSANRCSFDWREMASFILNDGYDQGQADQARIKIARNYYWAENRASRSRD